MGSGWHNLSACVTRGQLELFCVYQKQLPQPGRYSREQPCAAGVDTAVEEEDSWAPQLSLEVSVYATEYI